MTAISVLVVGQDTSTSIVVGIQIVVLSRYQNICFYQMTVFGFTYFGIATTRFLTASLAVSLLLLELRGAEIVK